MTEQIFNKAGKALTTRLRRAINTKLNDSEPSQKVLDNILQGLQEIGEGLTPEELDTFLKDQAGVLEERDAIFHPENGMAKYFAINNQPLSGIITTGNRNKAIDETIAAIQARGVSQLNFTLDLLDDKENVITTLKGGLDNSNLKGDTAPFSEEELTLIKGLLDLIENIDEEKEYELKESEFKQLNLIADSLSQVQVMKVQEREKYYKYWKEIYNEFQSLHDYLAMIQPAIQRLARELGGITITREGGFTDTEVELGQALESVVLPNYVLKLTQITRSDYTDEAKKLKLTYQFLRAIRADIPESLQVFREVEELEGEVQSSARVEPQFTEDGNPVQGGGGASIDENLQAELTAKEKEAAELLKRQDVGFDPLYVILGIDKEVSDISPNVVNEVKQEIKSIMRTNQESKYIAELEELLDEEIDLFLDQYKDATTAMADENQYYLPMMDNDEIIEAFTTLGVEVEVEASAENFDIVTKRMPYKKAVEYINAETKGFFRVLGRVLQLSKGTIPIARRSVTPKGASGQVKYEQMYMQGGESLELPIKVSEVDAQKLQELDSMVRYLEEYYMEPLGSDFVLLGDVPEFFTSAQFRDIFTHLKGTRKQQVKRALRQGYVPFVDSRDYGRVMDWLDLFKDPQSLYISDKLINTFEEALSSFVKFWEIVNNVAKETDEAPTEEITKEIKSVMGAMLYEIAFDSLGGDESKVAQWKWRRQPLSYWKEQQENNNYTIENLLVLLEDPDWKVFIEDNMAKDKQLRRKHEALINKLKKPIMKMTGPITHAMLEATDMIRKMAGQRIYRSNLDITDIEDLSFIIDMVKKENKVDIYGVDIYNIVKSDSSFNSLATNYGISQEVVYKIKGMFR
tara:strand:- start:6589 stop:9165 length:2577 start_codon:yes stop_codon:yes gene_type:complete